ncbi:hypothetical protein SAMN05421636_1491 [Pricia antarctica]|uniref:Lipoprotein n=1 Tax=Pricia antarctica TaxID=641691 RepID=A0A1G7JT27_9FLAO|nr:hypothetical protein [Pricia antarctica]SDF28056.1 hypothetical protein SAMN05421636_1491 [Pricia antarctica]
MNLNFAKYLIIVLLLASCGKQETEIKNYGFLKSENTSLNVPLELSQFKNYGILLDRIREITCNDSIANIVVKQKNLIRNLYPIEHCEPIKFDPKGKHYVSFEKGKAFQDHFSKEIKADDLSRILTTDFAYPTSNESRIPESYLVIIESNRNEKVNGIEDFLTDLTHNFDKLNTKLELNVSFWEVVPYMPPTEMEKQTE